MMEEMVRIQSRTLCTKKKLTRSLQHERTMQEREDPINASCFYLYEHERPLLITL